MTKQYLLGELSLILAELEDLTASEASVRDVARLRREAETGPLTALTSVTVRALELVAGLCQDSLGRGDAVAFACQSAIGAELRDFGVCAGLLEEAPVHMARAGR
jgi:hypothetical protein